ncbi:MAG: V-type ATP synthase subunit F [Bacillota bacterium]|jgi:V/A-type H+-transporting ATPase subunit F
MSRAVAIIADNSTVGVFAALGFDTFQVKGPGEAAEALRDVARGDYGLVYITEDLAAELEEQVKSLRERTLPVVGIIPGPQGSRGVGFARLKDIVEKAIGADILFKGEER